MRVFPGQPYPLGATWDGAGVNFALFSEHAERVELCLFEHADSAEESVRIPLASKTHHVWHAFLPDARPGLLYGYRVHGRFQPSEGHRFNANKLLLDPYAKVVARAPAWRNELFGYPVELDRPEEPDPRDSAPFAALGAVVDDAFSWGDDRHPRIPWRDTVIYETHVKGLTQRHPDVPEGRRGTYRGLTSEAVIEHLQQLGVTAVELLPVHEFMDERRLHNLQLKNYWGYNSLGFFAPTARYSCAATPQGVVDEFKQMVRLLHAAGLEVILDVVYNHTCEGNHLGSTLSLKGIDNAAYYRLVPHDRRHFVDFTGCGNTVNTQHPRVLQMVVDSLRYWVEVMHVDGFRFDLASALGREAWNYETRGGFFKLILQDPVLSQVKMIAEPWDVGSGGYQVGNYPAPFSEWNGRYRDDMRRYWKGDHGVTAAAATRFAGSSDLYQHNGRNPFASVNFITSHDGFPLADLVSYTHKHNEANKEDNRDGDDNNNSWNCGVEGPTDDAAVLALRGRQIRNFLTTLILSQGAPMLTAGDEMGRSQGGNNNAYCQDNEISWVDWNLSVEQRDLLEFTRFLLRVRREQPALRRRNFFRGLAAGEGELKDITWHSPSGQEMTGQDWGNASLRCLGAVINGESLGESDERGRPVSGDTLLIVMNASEQATAFTLPEGKADDRWERVLDTSVAEWSRAFVPRKGVYRMQSRSSAVFRLVTRSRPAAGRQRQSGG